MKYIIILAIAGLLAACTTPTTGNIGASVDEGATANPPGQNTFSIKFDPGNPGVPSEVIAHQGKDEDKMAFSTTYTFPDGRSVTWQYGVEKSAGSQQTATIADALIKIAQAEAETVQAITPEVVKAIVDGLKIAVAPGP